MCRCGADFASSANTRILVQVPTFSPDDLGGRTTIWSDLLSLWAVVEPMASREVFVSFQQQSRVDSRITVRYRAALADTAAAARYRITVGTRIYNIAAALNLASDLKTEGREFQRLLCTEGQPA